MIWSDLSSAFTPDTLTSNIPTPIRITPYTPDRSFTIYSTDNNTYKIAVECAYQFYDKKIIEAKTYQTLYDALYYILNQYCTLPSTNTIVFDYGENYEKMIIVRYAMVHQPVQTDGKITYIYAQTVISIPTGFTWCITTDPEIMFHTTAEDIIYHVNNNLSSGVSADSAPANNAQSNNTQSNNEQISDYEV